jgi:plastocyanin
MSTMHTYSRCAHSLIASLSIALVGACGGDDSSPTQLDDPTPVQAATVQATPAERFTPGRVNLIAGGTVRFDFGSLQHNVFFDNAPAGAPANITAPSANTSVTLTFPTAGTFAYNCHLHPGMSGTVVVE